jgi:hypothetical protein
VRREISCVVAGDERASANGMHARGLGKHLGNSFIVFLAPRSHDVCILASDDMAH